MNLLNVQNILDGCLLGDGCLYMGKKSKNACFLYRTSSEEHAKYIHNFFKQYCSDNYQILKKREIFDKRTEKTYVSYYFNTKCLPFFTENYNRFYENNIKIVPKNIKKNKELLLFWYIGDGELNKNNGTIKLHTNSFTESDVNFLCELLKDFKARKTIKDKNSFIITIPRFYSVKFLDFIGKCPIKDYSHKWNNKKYINKNIELNGINSYLDKLEIIYSEIKKDTEKHPISFYGKKHNVPIACIVSFLKKRGQKYEKIKLNKIYQYDLFDNLIKVWSSANEVKKVLGYDNGAILKCAKGKRKKHMNFFWKFN